MEGKRFFICGDETLHWKNEEKQYALSIYRDEYPEDPRKWDGTLTTMACLHRRYDLGDDIGVRNEDEFYEYFQGLVKKHVGNDELLKLCLDGKLSGLNVRENVGGKTVDVTFEQEETVFDIPSDKLTEEIIDDLSIEQCLQALQNHVEWLPLWLYDHSGITMSCGARTGQYADRWDSGCVGFILAEKKTIMEGTVELLRDENGYLIIEEHTHENHPSTYSTASRPLTEETWRKRAIELMQEDVKLYDMFLTGDVYGFTLYEAEADDENPEWEEIDSCAGFYGDDLYENGIFGSVGYGFEEALKNDEVEKMQTYSASIPAR